MVLLPERVREEQQHLRCPPMLLVADLRIGMCVDMSVDMCIDTRVDMCVDM